ncbi:MAG: hypothetical protein GF330_11485 [Candidatus Eisenbacteria bacterium]|nr:hypothetical protein [Candidatus Eisenbacteria bacterium]
MKSHRCTDTGRASRATALLFALAMILLPGDSGPPPGGATLSLHGRSPGRSLPPGHNCRFWGAIGASLSDSLIDDHLRSGEFSLKALGSSNPNGWGLGIYAPALAAAGWEGPAILRGGPPADHPHDLRYDAGISQMQALDPTCAIAHVRYSSGSHSTVPDPHPFLRGGITLCHNGRVYAEEMIPLLEADDPDFLTTHPLDYTDPAIDSELLTLYIVKLLESGVPDGDGGTTFALGEVVREAIFRIYDNGALWTGANCLVSNGDTLVGVRFDHDEIEMFRLRYAQIAGSWVVASEAVGSDTTGWETVPPKHLGLFTPQAPPELVRIYPPSGAYLVVSDSAIDDDGDGGSDGNSDGDADAGETIELSVTLRNDGFEDAVAVHATLQTADSLCQIIDDYEEFGDIPVGETRECLEDFDLWIDPRAADGHLLELTLHIECNGGEEWNRDLPLEICAPRLSADGYEIDDSAGGNGNGRIDPGEQIAVTVTLRNDGHEHASGIEVTLDVSHPEVEVLEGFATLDSLRTGESLPLAPPFLLQVSPDCPDPDVITAELEVAADWGIGVQLAIPMPVGGIYDDMESGPGGWSHYVVTGGYQDQWHRSDQRNYTPGGAWSWKFGATGGGDYAHLSDGALESQTVTLRRSSYLRFRHWMEAEESGSYPGYCYDGGIVEMNLDDGGWEQIFPVGGYTHLIRNTDETGPFPPETPAYSGNLAWEEAVFELLGQTGQVRFRLRFGSDDAIAEEGWYIDEVEFFGTDSLWAGAEEGAALELHPALGQSRPNPGGPGLRIAFRVPARQTVQLRIFDVNGRAVRELLDGTVPPGPQSIAWNGRDDAGRTLPAGAYFYRLETPGLRETRRLVLLR